MKINIEHSIRQITVYPDRARVTCQGECDLAAGNHLLVMDELPLSLTPDSIRAAGKGTAQVRILGVDLKKQHYEETPVEHVRQLEREIEQLEDEMRVLDDDKAGWLAHAIYLDGLRQATKEFAKGLSRGRTNIDNQTQLTHFIRKEDKNVRASVRGLENQLRELRRKLNKKQQELKAIGSARPRQRFQAQIEIEVMDDGDFQAELSYLVRNAGWQPLYDVRFTVSEEDQANYSLDVSYLAQVTQNTGQDWQHVDLIVSTARPVLNQRLPELKPWYVDVYNPPQPRRPMMRKEVAQRSTMPAVTAIAAGKGEMEIPESEPLPTPAQVAVATVQESGTAVSFSVTGKIDIPSDGSPHKTTLNQFTLDPTLDYLAAPKHTDAVFRRATVLNNSSSSLMAGQANLFVDDEFIGRTNLEYTPVGGEIELLLGVEERITVERELTRRDVDKRLLRDNRQLHYGYDIEVENLLKTAVKLEVHDHIPISRHEQIKIHLERSKPEPTEKTDLNLLEWRLRLEPNEVKNITYSYSVEHPRSLKVAGLID